MAIHFSAKVKALKMTNGDGLHEMVCYIPSCSFYFRHGNLEPTKQVSALGYAPCLLHWD